MSEGSCPLHPAIRLKRYNRRTNEWKTLLETCPLCASGLPATASSSAANRNEIDDDETTVSSRSSSRYSRSFRGASNHNTGGDSRSVVSAQHSVYSAASGMASFNSGMTTQTGTVSTYSAATTLTNVTGGSDLTYITSGGQSMSSMSTRKQDNSHHHDRYNNATTAAAAVTPQPRSDNRYYNEEEEESLAEEEGSEGYRTEDNEETDDLDSSSRSGLSSKGVRFGPGTKEGSDLGTESESDFEMGEGEKNYDHIRDSVHSNYDDYADMEENTISYNSNNELNEYMTRDADKRNNLTPVYSNTPPVKNPMPSALRRSTLTTSVTSFDGNKQSSDLGDSSLTSLNDEQSQPKLHAEKQKYRPPPPPRRDTDDSFENTSMAIVPVPDRSTSRTRNERSSSRSRDVRPAPPQRTPSQPRSSSRSRGSSSRGRDSSRSRPREGDSRPAPPPVRSRSQSRSRQPSRSRGGEDRAQPPSQSRPAVPVGILRNSKSGSNLHEDHGDNALIEYDDNAARHHSNNQSRPAPPPRTTMPPSQLGRMRMEPPETPPDEVDNYSINSRDRSHSDRTFQHGPPQNRGPRRAADMSGQRPNIMNNRMPSSRIGRPMHDMHDEPGLHRDLVPVHPPPPSRPVQHPADHSESSSEHQSRSKTTPKKNNRRNEQSGYTESETNISDGPSANADHNDSETPAMAKASDWDDKGRCVKHPHIKLRKKKMLGGWKVMLVNCPDCCIEEMLKMRRKKGDSKAKSKRSPSLDSNSSGHPPIRDLTIRNKDDDDRSSSSGSASEITYGTRGDYSRSSQMGGSWQQYGPGSNNNQPADNSGTSGSGPHRVTRMPFTDAYGHKGWYTGEVASGSGLPHGKGTMHYCDGRMKQGLWSNGLVAAGGSSGGAGNSGRKSSNDSVGSHQSQQSRRSRNPPPPSRRGEKNVVVGMEWMDYDGRNGFYTGETDDNGRPHGMGSLRYNDGKVVEGEFYQGKFGFDRSLRGDGSVTTSRSRNRGF